MQDLDAACAPSWRAAAARQTARSSISADATCCILRGAKGVAEAFRRASCGKAGAGRQGATCAWRGLPRVLRDRAHGDPEARGHPLPAGEARGRAGDHQREPCWAARSSSACCTRTRPPRRSSPAREAVPFYGKQNRLILGANERIEPTAHRGLHRHRRLRRAGQGPGHEARGDHRGDQGLGPARPRRRRLPHRQASGRPAATPRARTACATSSATPTRATPAPTWTARSWRPTRTR